LGSHHGQGRFPGVHVLVTYVRTSVRIEVGEDFLLTKSGSNVLLKISRISPPPRSEGCRAFDFSDRPPDAPLFCELISFRPPAEVTGQLAVISRHIADSSARDSQIEFYGICRGPVILPASRPRT